MKSYKVKFQGRTGFNCIAIQFVDNYILIPRNSRSGTSIGELFNWNFIIILISYRFVYLDIIICVKE